jgi:hypothetical protein
MTPYRALVIAAIVASSATACGVATSDDVEIADPADVPFGLLERDRIPVALPVVGATVVEIHLFDPDISALVPVTRQLTTSDPAALLEELESGPTDAEALLGLRSPLADLDALDGVDVDGSTAVVDLNDSFNTLGGSDQIVAIVQLVYTATENSSVEQIVVRIEGETVEVPRDDGTLTSDPLTREAYRAFAPS